MERNWYFVKLHKAVGLGFFMVWISITLAQTSGILTGAGNLNWAPGLPNSIASAVPFLRLDPDARAEGMGAAGIATSADANALYLNPAKLAFINTDGGFSGSFDAWLFTHTQGPYLGSLSGYYKIRRKQVIALSARYFTYGQIQFTSTNGNYLNTFRPNEFALDAHYARQLGPCFSISGSIRFIYSDFAENLPVSGAPVKPCLAGSGDLGWYFHKSWQAMDRALLRHTFSCGMALTNMGNKIYYSSARVTDYLPANLGIGFCYRLDIGRHHSLSAAFDLNKLMVPAPYGAYDSIHGTYYYREESAFKGMYSSFGDAPALYELQSISESVGLEYFYRNLYGFRLGYFYQNPNAGGRQYVTAGVTARFSILTFHFAYLVPTPEAAMGQNVSRNPLNCTMQLTLVFDFFQKGRNAG